MCFDLIYLDDYAEKCGTHFEHRTSKGGKAGNRNPEQEREWEQEQEPEPETATEQEQQCEGEPIQEQGYHLL